jgi:hypothetical protein
LVKMLNAWNLLLGEISADRDTEVVVLTGTGNAWLAGVDAGSFAQPPNQWPSDLTDEQYKDGVRVLERIVHDLDVPNVAATLTVDDLTATHQLLIKLGAEIIAPLTTTPNGRRMIVRHPDGAVYEYVGR